MSEPDNSSDDFRTNFLPTVSNYWVPRPSREEDISRMVSKSNASRGVTPAHDALFRAKQFRVQQRIESGEVDLVDLIERERLYLDKIGKLEKENRRLKSLGEEAASRLRDTRQERDRLATKLAKQTERVDKFKKAYDGLRQRPVVRAANLLSDPKRLVQRLGLPAPCPGGHASASRPPGDGTSTASSTPLPDGNRTAELGGSVSDANRKVASQKSPMQRVRELLNEGHIRSPYEYLQGLSDEHATKVEADWLKRLRGQVSLLDSLPVLPPTGLDPAYLPQRGRIMYCAHSTAEFQSNGYSTRTSHLASALGAEGHDIFVAARPGYPWDSQTDRRAPVGRPCVRSFGALEYHYDPSTDWSRTPLDIYLQQAADSYVRKAQSQRAATIHSASNYYTALPALTAARRLGIPFVYEVRGLWEITELASKTPDWRETDKFRLAERLETFVATNADRVLAITDEVKAELVRRGVDERRIDLLPNAADPAVFVPTGRDRQLAQSLDIRPEDYVIGYAGSMVAYEGLDLLIRAFKQVHQAVPRARLLLVGDGKERESLGVLADELGLGSAVIFTGRVKPTMVRRYLTLFDVAPCPRRSNVVTEMVSPLKPLEAMAAGIPVVGSDVAPIKHLIGEEQQRGRIFEADNADALAEVLIELGQRPSVRGDVGRAARQWAVENRSWTAVARLATAAYEQLSIGGLQPDESTATAGRPLSSVRLGLIADEFTFATFSPECRTVALYPETWSEVLDGDGIDVLLVESAWAGNEGAWTRGVGYYSDEEIAPLRNLVEACRARGIPTIFWNKEDPVHTERFIRTSALFDHVFTTDADCIRRYATEGTGTVRTVASLPFFAQAALHHPLPVDRPYEHTVAYGGSYYGDRYPDRSAELSRILGEVEPHGLTIYDRQVNHENSPYRFPERLAPHVQGGLEYPEMVAAYKSHPVHVNVNSVDKSPTMFSRRVMELAGCGTPVISGRGRGVTSLFGRLLPLAVKPGTADLLADYWLNEEAGRNADGWRLHRHVYRAHLATHRLAYMLRTAGLGIAVDALPEYVLDVDSLTPDVADQILGQTHRPVAVRSGGGATADAVARLNAAGIVMSDGSEDLPETSRAWLGDALADPEVAEDLARSLWLEQRIECDQALACAEMQTQDIDERGKTLLVRRPSEPGAPWFGRKPGSSEPVLVARRAIAARTSPDVEPASTTSEQTPRTIIVAGHDLKFARALMERLASSGHTVLVDEWQDHAKHDPEQSKRLLAQADVIFCEWSLGNAEWYARHVRGDQRLIVRFHSQELFTAYPERTDAKRFDATVYVGRLVRDMAVSRLGYPAGSARIVPNAVEPELYNQEKTGDARFNLGLVGIVPQQKHLDRALDVLRQLRLTDQRYQLFIKGKTPEDYPWMAKREDEMAYYNAQYARITDDPLLAGAVHFDGHGNDMVEWYRKIGVVLSVSDFESFHLTLADGGASGALPVSLAWPGSEYIYPGEWLHLTVGSMAERILGVTGDAAAYREATRQARQYCRRFHADEVLGELERVVLG
ncbi:hypothetical protein GCM10022377_02240 [Zhihengliuella alba]|uniref:D-inositol 3-phosphate glycosyltransferase n=1 Tax=Zhihengliuella alba TaxID=547018 RepID=A0ABP7CPF0_9MICC